MPYKIKVRRLSMSVAIVSWLLLMLNILLIARRDPEAQPVVSLYLSNVLSVVFILSVFLYQRIQAEHLRGTDFSAWLWQLFMGAGVAGYVIYLLWLASEYLPFSQQVTNPFVLDVFYQVVFGILVFFLAKAFYVWRSMILFQKTKALQIAWKWFEILIYATLIFPLLNIHDFLDNIFFLPPLGLMVLFSVFVSVNLKWVAFLSLNKKWVAIFMMAAILGSTALFTAFLFHYQNSPGLVVDYSRNPFILIVLFFVFVYALMSFLVALFSLPTSSVFEQKREDLLNIQRMSQSIQQGEDEAEVYNMLFESALKAASADAAWLEVQKEETNQITHILNTDYDQINLVREKLKDYNISNIDYINNDLPHNTTFRNLGLPFGSLIVLPLKSNKRSFGRLYLLKEIEHGFDRENVNTLRTFINQTILTLENLHLLAESLQNERYKEELKIASVVQNSLIPKKFPSDSWFEISTYSQPAKEVGGDFYDFIQVSESRIAIIIGDVSGKGISAAFHMAQMKGIFHGLMQLDFEPEKFMHHANSALSRCLEKTSFITSAIYIIDYKLKGFVFARAGHCHTLYYNSMTEDVFYFQTEGLGLGIIRDPSYKKHIKQLHYDYNPNDVMVIYTDGIIEARDGQHEEYGLERLQYLLTQTYHLEAEDIKCAIINDLNSFSGDTNLHDDQTLLVIKFKNVQPNF
jgi:phosphoserine phosphatase RsbU/P